MDTTWRMAHARCLDKAPRTIEIDGPPQANVLLRWLGVRAVPHLPCRADCDDTIRLADDMLRLGRDAGFAAEAAWMMEVLSWPVEWSALHGIAEIRTPIAKAVTRTDATAQKRVVCRRGRGYPAEGARGVVFPFRGAVAPGVRETLLAPAIVHRRDHSSHDDNGFSSEIAKRAAHRPIVERACEHFGGLPGRVLDLGCGNGVLLNTIRAANARLVPYGVDADASKIERARQMLPGFAANFYAGDMFDPDAHWPGVAFDLILLMPGRLLEVEAARGDRLRAWLRAQEGFRPSLRVRRLARQIRRPGAPLRGRRRVEHRLGPDQERPRRRSRSCGMAPPRSPGCVTA